MPASPGLRYWLDKALFAFSQDEIARGAPALSIWRAPRMNLNVEDNPVKIVKGFTDNLYPNFFMHKPNHIWGSAWFHDPPAIHTLIEDLSSLRRQFLPYFTFGILLGDGVMDHDWTALHVAGYQLPNSLLVFVLNDRDKACPNVKIGIDLARWFGRGFQSGETKLYNLKGECTARKALESSLFRHTFSALHQGELQIIEIAVQLA